MFLRILKTSTNSLFAASIMFLKCGTWCSLFTKNVNVLFSKTCSNIHIMFEGIFMYFKLISLMTKRPSNDSPNKPKQICVCIKKLYFEILTAKVRCWPVGCNVFLFSIFSFSFIWRFCYFTFSSMKNSILAKFPWLITSSEF